MKVTEVFPYVKGDHREIIRYGKEGNGSSVRKLGAKLDTGVQRATAEGSFVFLSVPLALWLLPSVYPQPASWNPCAKSALMLPLCARVTGAPFSCDLGGQGGGDAELGRC